MRARGSRHPVVRIMRGIPARVREAGNSGSLVRAHPQSMVLGAPALAIWEEPRLFQSPPWRAFPRFARPRPRCWRDSVVHGTAILGAARAPPVARQPVELSRGLCPGMAARERGTDRTRQRRGRRQSVLLGVLREHLATFLARTEEGGGAGLPRFVRRELCRYLDCGILAFGFARVHCSSCGQDELVAFSCKGRGFFPSCGGRRHGRHRRAPVRRRAAARPDPPVGALAPLSNPLPAGVRREAVCGGPPHLRCTRC